MGHLAHLITVPTNTHLCKVTCECVFASFMTLHYKKLEFPLSKDAMFQILLKYSSDSEEEDETEKLTDGRQTTGVQKSFRDFSSSKLIILFEKKKNPFVSAYPINIKYIRYSRFKYEIVNIAYLYTKNIRH